MSLQRLGLAFSMLAMTFIGSAIAANPRLVPGPFNATAYNQLLDCISTVSNNLHIAIDDGVVVIIPPEDEILDTEGEHSALVDCLDAVSWVLNAAIDSNREIIAANAPIQSAEHANAQWAESHGAEGIQTLSNGSVGIPVLNHTAGEETLSRRQTAPSYYYAYGSDFKDCSSADSQPTVFNECISHSNSYASISFGNAALYNSIRVRLWPHHQCAVDYSNSGVRVIVVPAAADSTSQKKTTFSYYGALIPRSCFGTCS